VRRLAIGSRGGDPEGVVIFHTASGQLFKKTIKRPLSRLLADHAPMPVELFGVQLTGNAKLVD
jgi:hypothetical protein